MPVAVVVPPAYLLSMTKKRKTSDPAPDNILPLHGQSDKGQEDQTAFTRRWGKKVADHGYTMVPTALFRMQARLGLNPSQFLVLLQLLSHWFKDDSLPWPSKDTIATRLRIRPRQLQRILTDLEDADIIKRRARYRASGGQTSNAYDLSGLVRKLKTLEPEYKQMKAENEARRVEVETPIGRRRKAGSPSASK